MHCANCLVLKSALEELIGEIESGPCCGSGDDLSSHYHCSQCGKVGGMYVCNAISGTPNCEPNPENEYIKRKTALKKVTNFLESLEAEEFKS